VVRHYQSGKHQGELEVQVSGEPSGPLSLDVLQKRIEPGGEKLERACLMRTREEMERAAAVGDTGEVPKAKEDAPIALVKRPADTVVGSLAFLADKEVPAASEECMISSVLTLLEA
jgi:hypothetical protein